MTVWLVAQPTRGLLIERALARLAGTAVGAAAGALILLLLEGRLLPSLAALLPWLALCAGLGSVFRHFRNYGFVLAGYTAAIVVLFGLGDGAHDGRLAMDRVACTVIGIVCSALASMHGVSSRRDGRLAEDLEELLQRCLDRVGQHLHRRTAPASAAALIDDIARLDRTADDDAAGSLGGRRAALRVRRVSGLLLELLALMPQQGERHAVPPDRHGGTIEQQLIDLSLLARYMDQSALAQVLDELRQVLRQSALPTLDDLLRDSGPASLLRAGARPVIALAITAAIWLGTGWQAGPMMVMTAVLFTSLFSSHGQGNQALLQVLVGSLLGALAGMAVRLLLLPHADGWLATLSCIAPFLLLGAWLMRRPRTAKMAIDLNMTFLLTAHPMSAPAPMAVVFSESAAIVAGVLAAVATFWLFLPATPQRRRRQLARRIARLARSVQRAPDAVAALRAQRAMRAAQVRLLDSGDPGRELFDAAQDCLAHSRRAIAGCPRSPVAGRPRACPTTADEVALRRACMALEACIASTPRDGNSR